MPTILSQLSLTSYRHPDTAPFGNIMLLPEAEAYQTAAQLAAAHPGTTAFYRFADFANDYPRRKTSEEALRQQFIQLGGQPELLHPYSFVLMESRYWAQWFGNGPAVRVPVAALPAKRIYLKHGYREAAYHIIETDNGDFLCYDEMVKQRPKEADR